MIAFTHAYGVQNQSGPSTFFFRSTEIEMLFTLWIIICSVPFQTKNMADNLSNRERLSPMILNEMQ